MLAGPARLGVASALLLGVSVSQGSKTPSATGAALLTSAGAGDVTSAARLIEAGAPLQAQDLHQRTPLHRAVLGAHDEMVALLIEKGAEVNARDLSGETPLHEASREGFHDIVELLLDGGAQVDAAAQSGTALSLAHQRGFREIEQLLVSHGARPADSDIDPARRVDALFAFERAGNRPGGVVLVMREGKVLLSRGYGLADVEKGIANTPTTKLRIGSLTKPFVALALLQLRDAGELTLEDRLSRFLPEFPRAGDITLRQLLCHTSGMKNWAELPAFQDIWNGKRTLPEDTPEAIVRFADEPLAFPPGDAWLYSSSGYIVLGHVVEKVSGLALGEYLEQKIFQPLAMADTGCCTYLATPDHAVAYEYSGETFSPARDGVDMSFCHGDGAMYSTAEDLARFARALPEGKVVPRATLEEAFRPGRLADGTATRYGLGWEIYEHRGLTFLGHSGIKPGFHAFFGFVPEQRFFVAVLQNSRLHEPVELALRIAEIYLGDVMLPQTSLRRVPLQARPESCVGEYRNSLGVRAVLSNAEGRLFVEPLPIGDARGELLPLSDKLFAVDSLPSMRVEIELDAGGKCLGLVSRYWGVELHLRRQP
jgi:CubicO group peptidase (beta-lactamase class C family)